MVWRKFLLTGIICFCGYTTIAQQLSREYINLCNDFFRYWHIGDGCGKLDCTVTIDSSEGEWPGKNTYYRRLPCDLVSDSITFSPAELQYIEVSLHKQSHNEWDTGNILNPFIFHSRQYIDSIARISGENEPTRQKHGYAFYERFACHRLYQVSHPIFLRDNTVCIFYWREDESYGDGGIMIIYLKTKNGWEEFAELGSYIDG